MVLAACRQRRVVERVDLLAALGHESHVKVRRFLLGLEQAQRRLALGLAQLDAVGRRPFGDDRHPERRECLEEERLAPGVVADAEFDVVEHGVS